MARAPKAQRRGRAGPRHVLPRSASPARHDYAARRGGRSTGRRGSGPVALLAAVGVAFSAGIASASVLDLRVQGTDVAQTPVAVEASIDSATGEQTPIDAERVEQLTSRMLARVPSPVQSAPSAPDPVGLVPTTDPSSVAMPSTEIDASGLSAADRADGLLSAEVVVQGSGELVVVPGSSAPSGTGPVRTVRVEVEGGLPVDPLVFADRVMATLTAPGGWGTYGAMTFARTDGPADLRVVLASPATTDRLCAPLQTQGQYSCGRDGHAVLNLRRWVDAQDEFPDKSTYRQYLVNHEVGHLLGNGHKICGGAGQVAALMQQQSGRVAPCLPNAWPYPEAR